MFSLIYIFWIKLERIVTTFEFFLRNDFIRICNFVLSGYLLRLIYNSFIPIFWLEKSLLSSETFSSKETYIKTGFENWVGFVDICNILLVFIALLS